MSDARNAVIGRPREFDVDDALERAMRVFWERGYEGASLVDLTTAMGITKPSMYAAFGNKEQLFRRAVQRYAEGPGHYAKLALEEPTARAVAEAFLRGAVGTTTSPGDPAGCLSVQGALASGDGGRPARDLLAGWRNDTNRQLEERFRRAITEGDLPHDADPGRLARFTMTMAFGIAVQAAGGLRGEQLDDVVDMALRTWGP
ncbi:TetR/AcrR family transcriptional regulator [Patulibacter americanus]|uniref:TetR/AcrR family transcriptional regulator n=1 Tax=Patulibacter americanus TaxID=588672 RepID=UPI0003B4FEE1|nr:TetR/AcrR family transcriptional regulator [Patulibacter americanus]